MTSKFGENGEQFERFLEAAMALTSESVEGIAAFEGESAVNAARTSIYDVPLSAARLSALQSAGNEMVSTVLNRFPEDDEDDLGRLIAVTGFSSLLNAAARAIALRPQLDDETVGLLVDPFAELVGFEWRSWGVSSAGDLGPAPSAA